VARVSNKAHKATGRPHGGARPGAGRPAGTPNALPLGAVKAIQSLRLRVPADASEAAKELADRALQRVADVMNCKVTSKQANSVLKAAIHIREEVCGPVTRKIEVEGKIGIGALLDGVAELEREEKEAVQIETEKLPERPKLIGPIIRKKAATCVVATELAGVAAPNEEDAA
jgi:hypothetical protein